MITVEHRGEFAWDIVSAAPRAYYLHQQDKLEGTIGAIGSSPIYFFSTNHKESGDRKVSSSESYKKLKAVGAMTSEITEANPDLSGWLPPPYKQHFKNEVYKWDKPTLVISNKFTEEQGRPPTNFMDSIFLQGIFHAFSKKYQIVYIRPTGREYGYANDFNKQYDMDDYKARHPGIIYFNDLLSETHKGYNELQFEVMANCERFISVSGGSAAACSLWGGNNLVFYPGKRTGKGIDGFWGKLSGCQNEVFQDERELMNRAIGLWG